MSKRYVVRLWCRDCTGVDFLGCFDGNSELLNEGELFDTKEAAEEAGHDKTRDCGPWEFEVEEVLET